MEYLNEWLDGHYDEATEFLCSDDYEYLEEEASDELTNEMD